MPLDAARYHAWQGRRRPAWFAVGSIARATLKQLLRRKAYWIVLLIGLGQFIVYASVIYALTQMNLPHNAQVGMLKRFNFSISPEDPQDSGYLQFVEAQSLVVMLLLAFCGSVVIGGDFRGGVLPFYLSRPIARRHYIAGKLLAVILVVWMLTVVPALVLFIEYGLFTTSLDYWRENWRIVPALLGYGAVLSVVLAVWLAALSAYLQKLAPIAVTWSSLFVLMGRLAWVLRDSTGDVRWLLLDPWRDIRLAGRLFFGVFKTPVDRQLSLEAAMILTVATAVALLLLVRRVRAVEVVT